MFDFSVIPMDVRMGTNNCTSKFHNFSYWSQILTCDEFVF